jgi:outer membrane receptor protein involved in Fe transport
MTKHLVLLAALAVLVAGAPSARAEEADAGAALEAAPPAPGAIADIADMSLEDLLDIETTVATKSAGRSVRETPGIVTVLSRDEILRSGAKDLIEVLRLVPSFQFGSDVGAIYAGVRGINAMDGKILVLLDGHDMSELLYADVILGNRFPVDWIERVEVIRGPGSAIYGGEAELAVVNIVTRSAAQLHGVSATASYGQMLDGVANGGQSWADTYSQRYVSAMAGGVTEDGRISGLVSVLAGQGSRSDREFTDVYGDSYNMAGSSDAEPLLANLKLTAGGLTVGALLERYSVSRRDEYGANNAVAVPVKFYSSSVIATYDWKIGDSFTLTPRVAWTYQRPWNETDSVDIENGYYWNASVHRLQGGLTASWDATDWLNVLVGGEYTFDRAEDDVWGFEPDLCEPIGLRPYSDPQCTTVVEYHNAAVYAQGLATTKVVDVSLGARFEYHSQAGPSFVPRGALTKAFGPFHYKLLASQAFRAPAILYLAYSPDVTPEKTTVFEIELGYELTDYLFVVANGFFSMIDRPLVYYYDEGALTEGYRNYKKTGTAGAEAELKFKLRGHYADLAYGYYNPAGQNDIATFAVPGHDDVLLGFAQHKLTLAGGVEIVKDLTFNASGSLLFGDRYGYVAVDADGASVLDKFDPELILNANLMYRNLGVRGLFVQVGARNLTNGEIWYIQPYDNWHAPMPGPSAEVFVKIGYDTQP